MVDRIKMVLTRPIYNGHMDIRLRAPAQCCKFSTGLCVMAFCTPANGLEPRGRCQYLLGGDRLHLAWAFCSAHQQGCNPMVRSP